MRSLRVPYLSAAETSAASSLSEGCLCGSATLGTSFTAFECHLAGFRRMARKGKAIVREPVPILRWAVIPL